MIARRIIDGELEFARAVSELEELALVPHAEAVIKYVNQLPQLRDGLHDRPRRLCGADCRLAPARSRPMRRDGDAFAS
jgi:hypothetical protein